MKTWIRPVLLIAAGSALTAAPGHADSPRHGAPAAAMSFAASTDRQSRLEVNDVGMRVGNDGHIGYDLLGFSAGLEYPRGSGQQVVFTAGPWISGRVGGAIRTSIAEFGTEWVPGPIVGGSSIEDTLRFTVYRHTVGDTTGHAAWLQRAAPMGAPVDTFGAPLAMGDQTLWTVFNDAHGLPSGVSGAPRIPIGLETRLTAYAFDRPGVLRTTAYVRLRVINKGGATLDSAAIGLFVDPKTGPAALRAASDVSRDLGYAYPAVEPVGAEAVAVGVLWLRGPAAGATPLRPTSFVVYPNGSDPANTLHYDQVLRGRLPWGASMVDSSTGQPTTFFCSGDPVAGTGWVATAPPHPHMVLAAQPFTLAPNDTQDIDMAVVIGHGSTRAAAILDLRAAADEARAAFEAGFVNLPPPDSNPGPDPATGQVVVYPNPARSGARIAFRIEGPEARVEATVYDVRGRLVRRLYDGSKASGRHVLDWDGLDDGGRRPGAGIYFTRVQIGDRQRTARVVLLAGD